VRKPSRAGFDVHGRQTPWGSRLLYLGVFLLAGLVLLAALSFRREWQERIGQSRSDAIFQLVEGRTPARPTETPGAAAWLNLELRRYRERIADPERARLYGEVAEWQDNRSVPPFFAPLREVLARPLFTPPSLPPSALPHLVPPQELGEGESASSLRSQDFLELDHHWFAVTRRKSLESADPKTPSNRFLARVTPRLLAASEALAGVLARHPLPALPGRRPPRVVRLYALSEDGTLVTLPSPPLGSAPFDPQASRRAALAEGRELRSSPERPTFVSNEFYFRFDFADPREQTFYSGLYLDLGGQGLVATITVPLRTAETAPGIAGADLTFDIDWEAFARGIDPPMVAGVVQLTGSPAGVRHWTDLAGAPAGRLPAALRQAVAALARRPPAGTSGTVSDSVPNVLHGVVEGQGAVAAFQVANATWLLVLFPQTQSHLPLLPVLLSAVLLVALLAGFERNRRRAERAFAEKQNLLNTMQVPLIVVDPNTDEIVFGNQAAENLGLRTGERIGDLVASDPQALAHYERMQVARPEPRRAYGVPVRVRGEDGNLEERYAIVRSVAVTAPIEALHADERHRLGILFLVEPEADLALYTADLTSATRKDERRKLVGLLAHGADTLVRVLAHSLGERRGAAEAGSSPAFVSWLAGYLDRRLRTTAWLLDHWDAEPPLPPDSSIEAAQARATLTSLAAVFSVVARDADLRTRLHWDNGVLSLRPDRQAPAFTMEIEWPEEYWFACPVRGGFGFFLGEVLINAIRHGRPGSTPSLRVTLDRVRRELAFAVENEISEDARDRSVDRGETYGGRRILEQLARLFEWQDLTFERRLSTYLVSWRVPASERGDPRRPD
jgi:PAS domain-containing protein